MFVPFYKKMLSQLFLYTSRAIIPVLYPSSSNPHTGTTYYVGVKNLSTSPLKWASIRSTNPQNNGFFVSDDETPYNESIASFRSAPNVSITAAASSSSTDNSVTNTITYTLSNTSSEPITIRKICLQNAVDGTTTKGSDSLSYAVPALVFIHELAEPIEIAANGIAVIVLELKQEI